MKKRVVALIVVMLMSLTVFSSAESIDLDSALNDIEEMIDYIDSNYYKDIDRDLLIQGAYEGIFEKLDEHSSYLPTEQYAEFMKAVNGGYVGIGVLIVEKDGNILIQDIYNNSPAEKAGVQKGDLIVEVNGLKVKDVGYDKAIDMLLGEVESTVVIGIQRDGINHILNFNVIRHFVEVDSISYEMLDDQVGYIKIIEFSRGTSTAFVKAYNALKADGMERLIIDVRNNPGGLITEVIEIGDYFVPLGEAVLYVNNSNGEEVYESRYEAVDIPLAILVNENSASASEILAGTIKDNQKGVLIGTHTYGKGTVQQLYGLENGIRGGYRVTIAQFFTSGHNAIPYNGLTPDIQIKNVNDQLKPMVESFAPVNFKEYPKLGDTNLAVYGVEQRLEMLGYNVDVDGTFARDTQKAIASLQEIYELDASGLIDGATIEQLMILMNRIKNQPLEGDPQLTEAIQYLTQ